MVNITSKDNNSLSFSSKGYFGNTTGYACHKSVEININNIVKSVCKALFVLARNKNIQLEWVVSDKVREIILGDPVRVRQIVVNLINNAIKFTNSGGVEIELSKVEKEVLIKVKDTGIGIAKDKYDIFFEEFRQESEGHGRSLEGTGLGLAITKRFVELMKGTIEVESEIGVGSTFIMRFPYLKAPQTITIKIKNDEPKKEIVIPKPGLLPTTLVSTGLPSFAITAMSSQPWTSSLCRR